MQAVLYFIRSETGSQWSCCRRGVQFWWRGALRMRRAAVFRTSALVELQSSECPREESCSSLVWTIHKKLQVVEAVVSLLQTTRKKQGLSFIVANKVYTRTNKTTIVWIETELFPLPGVDASHVYVHALALGCFYSYISTGTFWGVLTASLDSWADIKSAPSVA